MLNYVDATRRINLQAWDVRIIAAIASILLSLIILTYQEPIAIDSITYIDTAKAFINGGLQAAMHRYNWPLYPIVIALLSQVTQLSLLTSAFIVNALFSLIITVTFVHLIKLVGGDRRHQLLGLFIFCFYPGFYHFRMEILRGYGYFAFALISIVLLIHYLKRPHWRTALLWSISLMIATLFRIEGIILWALVPLISLAQPKVKFNTRIQNLLRLYSIHIFIALAAIIFLIVTDDDIAHLGQLQHTLKLLPNALAILQASYHHQMSMLQDNLFNNVLIHGEAKYYIIGGQISLFITTLIYSMTPLYFILACHALYKKLIPFGYTTKSSLFSYVFSNIIINGLFIFINLFSTGRYFMLLSFILMLGIPFSIFKLYDEWRQQDNEITAYKILFPVVAIALVINAAMLLFHIGASKNYILRTGQWVQTHTQANSRILTNNPQLVFYNKRPGTRFPEDFSLGINMHDIPKLLAKKNLNNYNYLVLAINKHQRSNTIAYLKTLGLAPIKTIHSNNDAEVLIVPTKAQRLSVQR